MEEAIVVKLRNGYPTKKALYALALAFFGERDGWKMYIPRNYERASCLYWNKKFFNEKILEFCVFLKKYGIETEKVELFEAPRTGSLRIIPKL